MISLMAVAAIAARKSVAIGGRCAKGAANIKITANKDRVMRKQKKDKTLEEVAAIIRGDQPQREKKQRKQQWGSPTAMLWRGMKQPGLSKDRKRL